MNESQDNIRIDKFLWAARIFKTRSSAAEACRKGRITINNIPAKPSRLVAERDIIRLRKPPATLVYEVVRPLGTRLPARLVNDYIKDITPDAEKQKIITASAVRTGIREAGTGRPTKKDRRDIDRLYGSF